MRFDGGWDVCVRADGARDLAHRHRVDCPRQPVAVAVEFERPGRQFEPEGGRLGPDAVGPPHHHGVPVLEGSPDDVPEQLIDAGQKQRPRPRQSNTLRGVDDVGRGEAVVEPRRVAAHRSGEDVDECGQVVTGLPLAIEPGLDTHRWCCGNRVRSALRHNAEAGPAFEGVLLDEFPAFELGLVAPYRCHLGQGVALDHAGRLRVASRAGPTETMVTGTPVTDST